MPTDQVVKAKHHYDRLLLTHYKAGHKRPIKCLLDKIRHHYVGINRDSPSSHSPCPSCDKELDVIIIVIGRPTLKINRGIVMRKNKV